VNQLIFVCFAVGLPYENVYSKTCEVGHIFMEPANSYDIIHGHYSITWPPAHLESWPQFSPLVLCFMYKCNLPMLANLKILYFLCHTVYRPNPLYCISRTTICPLNLHSFSTSVDNSLEFPGGTNP
jgi:hypothetical protein